jgi:hypothetical protein
LDAGDRTADAEKGDVEARRLFVRSLIAPSIPRRYVSAPRLVPPPVNAQDAAEQLGMVASRTFAGELDMDSASMLRELLQAWLSAYRVVEIEAKVRKVLAARKRNGAGFESFAGDLDDLDKVIDITPLNQNRPMPVEPEAS